MLVRRGIKGGLAGGIGNGSSGSLANAFSVTVDGIAHTSGVVPLVTNTSSSGSLSPILLPCKTIMINENNEIEGCGIVDLSKWNSNACSLEYTILNNENK